MVICTSAFILVSGLMVVIAGNPVHSVLFIVLTFMFAGVMVMILGAEYLALTLLVVYVGAIAMLFLFVVMMIQIRVPRLNEWARLIPVGVLLFVAFGAEMWVILSGDLVPNLTTTGMDFNDWSGILDFTPTLTVFGQTLYTTYVYYFLVAGVVLLAAMVAAIILTVQPRVSVKRQQLFQQLSRNEEFSIYLMKDKN